MTTIVPTIQPSLDFAAQNDQLWKIIEKQRLIIQNLQKSLVKVTAERDNLLKKSRNHDLDDELTSTIIPEVDNNHHHIDNLERSSLSSSSESLQQPATYPEFSEAILLGPVPPPRSPYRQNSSKDVHNSTILHPNTPSAPAPLAAYALPSPMPFMSPEVHGTSVVQHNSSVDEDRFNRTQPNEFRRDFDGETLVSTSGIILSPTAMSVPITTAASMAAMAKTVTKPLPKNPFFSNMAGISVKVVGSSIKTNEKGKEAVYFIIAVIKTPDFSSSTSEELWRVEKQHSDIVTLDSQLKLQVRSAAQRIGKLPDKALFSTHAPNKVDQRKIAIEKYLQNAINVSVDDSNWLCEFLSTNVVTDQRHPSHPLGHKYGYLTKRGKNFGGWKTRYFSLEGPELHYYDGKDGPLLGTIRLYSAQIGRQTSAPQTGTDSSSDNRSFRHAFLILEPKKTAPNGVNRHVLCASSDAERDQWVEALAQYVNRQNASSEEENIKRNNNQKASKKGDKARKARSSDTVPTVPTNTKKTSYLPRSSSDTTLYPSESLSPSDATSSNTLTSIREKDIQALRDRSSADHVLFGQRQQFSKRNSISFPPREGTDELFRSSDYLSQISTTFDGNNPRPFYRSGTTDSSVEQDAKKAKQMINRRTFWGKKIFSSSSNEVLQTDIFGTAAPDSASSLGSASVTTATTMAATLTAPAAITSPSTSSSTANSNTNQSGGLRGLLSRSSSETAERAMADNKMSSTEMFGKPSRPVFGVPLEEAVRISRISEKYELPAIVYRCIEYLEAKDAFEEEGIYRLSGSAVKIKSLKDQFNQEGDINLLESEEYHDLHAVAGLLKMWLRELPGNILTSELMNDFMLVIDVIDRNERITELGRLVSLLPLANYTLLRTLSAHLVRVVQNAEINKMNMRNIGIVFSATLGIPSGIFHLLLTEFSYVFWTVNINNDDDDNDNDDSLITGGQYNYKSNVPLYQQNKDLYGLSSSQPELTLIEDSSKLHISRSMAEETSRSNRNSRSYMDGAPQIIVGLESQIELIGPLQIENNDICLDLSDFDCSENSGVSGKKFDFFKDVIEAGFPSSRQTVVKNDVHFDNSVANSY
ncbi:hypothetical protein F4703DRAFT_1768648 [Phycomyces blakesleeanus]